MPLKRKKVFFDLLDATFEGFPIEDAESVAVVSFFGKSFWDSDACKFDCFKTLKRKDSEMTHLPQVDGMYDPEARVIYLQLRGVLDVKCFVKAVSTLQTELNEKGYLSTWADLKVEYAKTLLLLFSISHIIVLSHPTAVFDISYLHLFRALENARKDKRPDVCQALGNIGGLAKDWLESGRPCSPRLLFRFLTCPREASYVRQLEHSLEDQIYHLLKRQKIVSSKSSNALFAIPANQEFVFVETSFERPGSRLITSVQNIVRQCVNPPPLPVTLNHLSVEQELQDSIGHKFDKFLWSHIDVALSKGLSDNVGRHLPPAPFTLPTANQFFQVARALIPLTAGESSTGRGTAALRACLDVDRKFSEGRCAKVLPLALAAYQETSLPHYPRRYHETRLAQALAVLTMQGRGAMMDKYISELEQQCNAYWQNGRQMCETLSLTGHPCINAIHRGGGDGAGGGEIPDDRKTEGLEEKEHCSGVRYISACNCGRKQGQRPDPYTLKTANFEFYRTVASECGCDKLESVKFAVFQPSVKDFRAAQLLGRRESLAMLRCDIPRSQLGGTQRTQQENLSLAFVSGPSIQGSCDVVETRLSCLRTQHPDILILTNQPGDQNKDKGLVRQASTTEYLPGMLHTESPTGLLPQFVSWSLVCVGASSVYSHNLGLNDQPGLLTGSSYLLPWDVTVRLEHQRKNTKNIWPAVSDAKRVGSQTRIRKNKGEQSEMVVKIFVGVEYECTRGHRFMAAAPDKVLKTGPSGQVRDTGHKVASSDMPLYFPCPCSKPNKPVVAQLLRLHVVTPKAPVRVTLNPKVQPAPNSPFFIACQEQPIPLTQSTYWVLRLPYVYMAERSPYVAPLEIPGPMYGRLLAGTFGIAEIPPERT